MKCSNEPWSSFRASYRHFFLQSQCARMVGTNKMKNGLRLLRVENSANINNETIVMTSQINSILLLCVYCDHGPSESAARVPLLNFKKDIFTPSPIFWRFHFLDSLTSGPFNFFHNACTAEQLVSAAETEHRSSMCRYVISVATRNTRWVLHPR